MLSSHCPSSPSFRYLLMSLLGLVSMGLFLLFTTNGCILHAWMNFNAEIMQFADRHFYEVGRTGNVHCLGRRSCAYYMCMHACFL